MTIQFRPDIPTPEYVADDAQARTLLYTLLRKVDVEPNDYIGFDTETHGKSVELSVKKAGKVLDWMSDTITFWSLAAQLDNVWHRWCLQQQHFVYFAPLMENPKALFAVHNLKYDAHIAWNCGINLWNARVHDTLAMANLHDENRFEHGLKALASDYCGLHMTPYSSLFTLDRFGNKAKEHTTSLFELDLTAVSNYASYDAFAHAQLAYWLKDHLMATPLGASVRTTLWDHYLDTEVAMTEILWRMERRGMPVDTDYLKSLLPVIDGRIEELEKDINRSAGGLISINSPQQLSWLFFGNGISTNGIKGLGLKPVKFTKGGAKGPSPSTDEEVLNILAESDIEIANKVVNCRKLYKTRNTYVQALVDLSTHFEDKRIHPNFHQFGGRTGRFSTSSPNSQNFPKPDGDEWGIRKAFIAPPGYKLLVSDYEQLEMRIMAHASEDPDMIKAINDGKDLHSFTVAKMDPRIKYEDVAAAKKVDSDKATPEQKKLKGLRQDFKAVGFGIIYGAGPGKISEQITIEEEAVNQRLATMDSEDLYKRTTRKVKDNPLLNREKATILVAKESIAAEKIDAYFQVFPYVKKYIERVPQNCMYLLERDFWQKPRFRPAEDQDPNNQYDWDMNVWVPGSRSLTRTGHETPFGFVQTLVGRLRRLVDIASNSRRNEGHAKREAVNVTIQGTAADLTKGAMRRIEFHPELNRLGVQMLNQIHDELVLMVPEENATLAAPIVKECMEHPFREGENALCVSIPVDLKIVDNWSQAK
jgi:DNA polymerase I-like protein with 3'-5' exonuclease and polymerase domains